MERFRWVAEAPRAREEAEDLRRSGPGGRRCSAALAGGGAAHHAQPEGAGERSDLHPGPWPSGGPEPASEPVRSSHRNRKPRYRHPRRPAPGRSNGDTGTTWRNAAEHRPHHAVSDVCLQTAPEHRPARKPGAVTNGAPMVIHRSSVTREVVHSRGCSTRRHPQRRGRSGRCGDKPLTWVGNVADHVTDTLANTSDNVGDISVNVADHCPDQHHRHRTWHETPSPARLRGGLMGANTSQGGGVAGTLFGGAPRRAWGAAR